MLSNKTHQVCVSYMSEVEFDIWQFFLDINPKHLRFNMGLYDEVMRAQKWIKMHSFIQSTFSVSAQKLVNTTKLNQLQSCANAIKIFVLLSHSSIKKLLRLVPFGTILKSFRSKKQSVKRVRSSCNLRMVKYSHSV